MLANLRDAMVANWDGTVADIDPEFLHDLRVAVRRTRVVLANAERVLPEEVRQRAREDFAWIGEISGTARDLDVYQIEWPDYTAALDATATEALRAAARAPRRASAQAAHAELSAQLSSARATEVVDSVERLARPPGRRRHARRPQRRSFGEDRPAADSPCPQGMVDRGRTITPATPAETVHELRKDAKKLRYLIECFGGLYDKSAAHGVRQPAQGVAGHPRRTPGRRGPRPRPAHDRRRSATGWSADTLLAIGQLDRAARATPGRQPRRARRALRRLRQQGDDRKALKELLASAGPANG